MRKTSRRTLWGGVGQSSLHLLSLRPCHAAACSAAVSHGIGQGREVLEPRKSRAGRQLTGKGRSHLPEVHAVPKGIPRLLDRVMLRHQLAGHLVEALQR